MPTLAYNGIRTDYSEIVSNRRRPYPLTYRCYEAKGKFLPHLNYASFQPRLFSFLLRAGAAFLPLLRIVYKRICMYFAIPILSDDGYSVTLHSYGKISCISVSLLVN